jgi:hypothetical protein
VRRNGRFLFNLPTNISAKFSQQSFGLPTTIFGESGHYVLGDDDDDAQLNGTLTLSKASTTLARHVLINPGYYSSPDKLIAHINRSANNQFTLSLNSKGMVEFRSNESNIGVIFSPQISAILGFRMASCQGMRVSTVHRPKILPWITAIMIYVDIISESPIGDSTAQLLRMIPYRHDLPRGSIMSSECFPTQYKQVLLEELSRIRVTIRSDTGYLLEYDDTGQVLLTLHFKPADGNFLTA